MTKIFLRSIFAALAFISISCNEDSDTRPVTTAQQNRLVQGESDNGLVDINPDVLVTRNGMLEQRTALHADLKTLLSEMPDASLRLSYPGYEDLPVTSSDLFSATKAPLVMKAKQRLLFQFMPQEGWEHVFRLSMHGDGSITINWGDGTTETVSIEGDHQHTFADEASHTVTIWGDIKNITSLDLGAFSVNVTRYELKDATNLRELQWIGYTLAPDKLDLSKNTLLESLNLNLQSSLQQLKLPRESNLSFINLNAAVNLSASSVDKMIENIYRSVLTSGRNGTLMMDSTLYNDSGVFIGPPSNTALQQLRILRDEYGWQISPNP